MAMDKLEAIRARVLAVLRTVDGVVDCYRNRQDLPPVSKCPAVILLDAREDKRTASEQRSRQPFAAFTWKPEIWVVLPPAPDAANEGVGEDLAALRMGVIGKLYYDEELRALLGGDDGEIDYRGFATDLQSGSTMEGHMRLDVWFTYVFDPEDTR